MILSRLSKVLVRKWLDTFGLPSRPQKKDSLRRRLTSPGSGFCRFPGVQWKDKGLGLAVGNVQCSA